MIRVHPKGRLGNLMFQYALSRIIGTKLGCATDMDLPEFTNAHMLGGSLYIGKPIVFTGHIIDLEAVFKITEPIKLSGFFQRTEYYVPYKEDIKKWFAVDKDYRKPGKNDLVVHVRGGDLYRKKPNVNHHPCPYSYYKRIIDFAEYDKLFIVTENPKDIVVQKIFAEHGGEIISQSPIEDYYFMLHATELALSPSTLAWWAAWLGESKIVHFPQIGFWHPKVRTDVDLRVDEPGYNYYDSGTEDWTASEEQIKALL